MKLTHLAVSQGPVGDVNLEHEFASAFDIAQELDEVIAQMASFEHSFEIYHAIVEEIKERGGVSKSMEAMFGENFKSADHMFEEASMEEVGFLGKIVNQVKEFFKKLWAWFQSILKGNDGVIRSLQDAMTKVDSKTDIFPLKVNNKFIFENGWVNRQIDSIFIDNAQTSELQKEYAPGIKGFGQKALDKVPFIGKGTAADVPNKSADPDTLLGGAFTIENADQFKNACKCLISALEALKSAKNTFGKIEADIEAEAAAGANKQGFGSAQVNINVVPGQPISWLAKKAKAVKAWAYLRLLNARVRAGAMYLCNRV